MRFGAGGKRAGHSDPGEVGAVSARRILVLLSDLHCGNQLGQLNPETVLEREDPEGNLERWQPQPTKTQEYLWALYRSHIDNVIELAAGDEIVVLVNGDITQGMKYLSLLVSTVPLDQLIIARDCLTPWLAYPNVTVMRLARGTASHVFGEGSSERVVSLWLQDLAPEKDIRSLYHGLADVSGVSVDYAHHGPGPGIRDWTQGNQLRYYLKSLVATEVKRGRDPARLVVRGHYHRFWPETIHEEIGGRFRQFDIVLLPSYCGMGDHGHQATRSQYLQQHGLVCVEIAYGQIVEIHPFVETLDLRTKETL